MLKNPSPFLKISLSATETASYLCSQLGGEPSYWVTWLANDRRPNRVNCYLPVEPGLGRPRYNVVMVETYVAECKKNYAVQFPNARHPGLTIGNFAPHISVLTSEEGATRAAVLFLITKPMASFMLSANEARDLGDRLIKAANEIDLGG